jgi:hypothetical protein
MYPIDSLRGLTLRHDGHGSPLLVLFISQMYAQVPPMYQYLYTHSYIDYYCIYHINN